MRLLQKLTSPGSYSNDLIFSGDFDSDRLCEDVDDEDMDSARCLEDSQASSESLILPYAELSTPSYVVCNNNYVYRHVKFPFRISKHSRIAFVEMSTRFITV